MQFLSKIIVNDFRNIALAELEFSPNVNCISGNNGEGKTNMLDAIYYLSMTKSAFSSSEKHNFRYGCETFSISGVYVMNDGLRSRFSIKVDAGGEKKIRRDDKPSGRISAHIGTLPVVMVSPEDTQLVSESGEERRRFANMVLSQMDSAYLNDIQQYNRLLAQRNRLLKEMSPDLGLLGVLTERMSLYADAVHARRKAFTEGLKPLLGKYYELISGGKEKVGIEYVSDIDKAPLVDILESHRERDLAVGYTTAGVQRDDFLFTLDGYPIRSCGSQGQQKSFLVALKFAQYELMREGYGFAPVLLLDDVFDKLDPGRISNLLGLVAGNDFGQIFITDCNKVRMKSIVDSITEDRTYYEAVAGSFEKAEA
ncbi:MAG: DNA replication/repair protein RecF [Bacteroidales bacterium]|nr:DNA replication/repair protein RecF [Bacteroidales bacterium]